MVVIDNRVQVILALTVKVTMKYCVTSTYYPFVVPRLCKE